MNCTCQTIGAPKELRRCEEHHRYWLGDRQLDSVSKVIHTLLPTDFSAVPPLVLECARLRGIIVDTYFSEWLTDPINVVPVENICEMVAPSFPADQSRYGNDV